jgi:hypothetical protein
MAGAMMPLPVVGIGGFWPGMLALAVAMSVGAVLGRFVGKLIRPSSGGPPDRPPHARYGWQPTE